MQRKKLIVWILGIFLVSLCVVSANAQRTKKKPTTKTPTANPTVAGNEIKEATDKIVIQIKNLSRFIFLLGSVANGIEDIDKLGREGKASREIMAKNQQNKESVISSIHNIRVGMIALESEFRTKPKLKNYLIKIEGVSNLCGNAEDLATAGQFSQSGKTLIEVVNKLTDTLASLP